MRVLRFLLFVSSLVPLLLLVVAFFPNLLLAQQTQSSTPTAAAAPQDAQAVSVLNQALSAAGGSQALKAVADYTGTGTITYHGNSDVQGSVTVRGLGSIEVRIDATLPSGIRSWAVYQGQTATKGEDGTITRLAALNTKVPSSDAFPYQTPLFPSSIAFPFRQLTNIVANPSFSISYKGIVQVDGHSAHDIQAQRVSVGGSDPLSRYHAREFFIDTSTFQIVMTQEFVPKSVIQRIHYSEYAAVSGVLVPFALAGELGGQSAWNIQLSKITFNAGLQDSDFALQ